VTVGKKNYTIYVACYPKLRGAYEILHAGLSYHRTFDSNIEAVRRRYIIQRPIVAK